MVLAWSADCQIFWISLSDAFVMYPLIIKFLKLYKIAPSKLSFKMIPHECSYVIKILRNSNFNFSFLFNFLMFFYEQLNLKLTNTFHKSFSCVGRRLLSYRVYKGLPVTGILALYVKNNSMSLTDENIPLILVFDGNHRVTVFKTFKKAFPNNPDFQLRRTKKFFLQMIYLN